MRKARPKLILVGAFGLIRGGVGLACKSLLDNPVSKEIDWIRLESGMLSLPPPGVFIRSLHALKRLCLFCLYLFNRPDGAVIFCSDGGSFLEKGLMAVIAHAFGLTVTLCPRSGILLDNLSGSKFFRIFAKLVFAKSDYVVCQGTDWKKSFEAISGADSRKFIVIPNLIDLSALGTLPIFDRRRDTLHVVMLGWLDRNKGVFDLIEVVSKNAPLFSRVRFTLCGLGGDEARLRETITRLGLDWQFTLPGWIEGPAKLELLIDADVYLMLSYREGLPNALLEAMAAGKAVLSTDVGAVPDVVTHRKNGLLCRPGDHEGIARALDELVRDAGLRSELGREARRHAMANHDLNTCADAWRAVLPLN